MSPFALSAKDALWWQPSIEPGIQRFRWHSELLGPLLDGQCFAVVGDAAVSPRVARLNIGRHPTTVARFIVTVVVNSVKRVVEAWPWADIFQKGHKGITPTLADFYAASAVKVIARSGGIGASLDHVRPNGILRRVGFTMMLFGLRPVAEATASCRMPAPETFTHYRYRPPAIALTQPRGLVSRYLADVANNGQSAEPLARHVLYTLAVNGYNLVSHVRTSNASMMRGLRGVTSALQSPLFYHNGEYEQQGQGPLT